MGPYSIARKALDLLRATLSRGRLTLHLRDGYASVAKECKGGESAKFFSIGLPPQLGRLLDPSWCVVLECRCEEKLILLGQEQDWQEEGRTLFRCECGRELTLAEDRVGKRALAIGQLLRRSIKAPRSV